MTELDEVSSRGPLTLKFFGVDDEITSDDDDEEEEQEEKHDIQTHTSDPVVFARNGNTHNLTVNNCYGKNYCMIFYLK